jgi:hypothetical protein
VDILFSNLPLNTTDADLRKLVRRVDDQGVARVIRRLGRGGSLLCYGLAIVRPTHNAKRFIAHADQSLIKGHPVRVREFIRRRSHNERRALNWRQMPWRGENRRICDRRTH